MCRIVRAADAPIPEEALSNPLALGLEAAPWRSKEMLTTPKHSVGL